MPIKTSVVQTRSLAARPQIQYLNTDLNLVCDVDPTLLVAEFETRDFAIDVRTGDDGLFYVMCEDAHDTEPEPNISRLLDVVDSLIGPARELWNRCSKRQFDVGYECGNEPWGFNQGLSNDLLRRLADCGSTFRITIYPHRSDSDNREVHIDS